MTVRRLVVVAAVAFAAFIVVTMIAVYLLWSRGEEPPTRSESVTALRQ